MWEDVEIAVFHELFWWICISRGSTKSDLTFFDVPDPWGSCGARSGGLWGANRGAI